MKETLKVKGYFRRRVIPEIILVIFFVLNIYNPTYSQEKTTNNFLEGGAGYYADILQFLKPGLTMFDNMEANPKVEGKILNGYNMSLLYGYNLKNNFTINIQISSANIYSWYNDPLEVYWDEKKIDSYLIFAIFFNKTVIKNYRYECSLGLGPLFRNWQSTFIDYEVYQENNEYYMGLPSVYKFKMNDMGVIFNVENTFKIKGSLYLGARLYTNLIFDIGFETFSILPFYRYYF